METFVVGSFNNDAPASPHVVETPIPAKLKFNNVSVFE
jgi:hypothetical protein